MSALLEVDSLSKRYPVTRRGLFRAKQFDEIRAVDNVSFRIEAGETLGLVGESGCGKTTTARAILNLVEPSEGIVRFQGQDIVPLFKEGDRAKVLQVGARCNTSSRIPGSR
jgi:ABC-type oligopeptide transport system ATPase subunit